MWKIPFRPTWRRWLRFRYLSKELRKDAALKLARATGKEIVHFIHVRKTGGSAIREAIGTVRFTPGHLIVFHEHATTLDDIPRGEKVAFFLRDPVERFVSGFNCRLRRSRPRYFYEWSEAEERAFARFGSAEELALALRSADEETVVAAREAMASISHVREHYSFWFGGEERVEERRCDILFVGYQESLADDFARLGRILELPSRVQLPEDDLKSHRAPTRSASPLSQAAQTNIRAWYADDVRFHAYCRSRFGHGVS